MNTTGAALQFQLKMGLTLSKPTLYKYIKAARAETT